MKRGVSILVLAVLPLISIPVQSAQVDPYYTAYMVNQGGGSEGSAAAPALSGKVTETMNSGGYTYVKLENSGKEMWVAVPNMAVKIGETMSFAPGMEMRNFESKSLNRTFETIIFSAGPAGGSSAADQSAQKAKATAAPAEEIKVEKASAPNAYTVAELHEKSAELDKKPVALRGKVVKVSPAIMGKNWIHIQDGSGSASGGTNDLLVTSQDLPAVGDVVTAKGTLYKDKDFGSGYKYGVIIEEAGIEK
jgi:hypothetical protein